MYKVVQIVVAGLSIALLPLSAYAGTISTPIIFKGNSDQLVCIANNVSTSQIRVTVRIIGFFSSATDSCVLAANDVFGCQVVLNNAAGQCRISISRLTNSEVQQVVRGVLFSRKITAPFATDAVVQAQ
jgi:hypothetical protein